MDMSNNTNWVSLCKSLSVFRSGCGCQTLAGVTRLFKFNFSTSLSLSMHLELGSYKTMPSLVVLKRWMFMWLRLVGGEQREGIKASFLSLSNTFWAL